MAVAKRAVAKPQTLSISRAVDPGIGIVTLNIFDGSRKPIAQGTQILLTITDGAQNQLFRDYISGPSVALKLPFHNNFADNYSIVAWADGYEQAGFQPVTISPEAPLALDLMLLKKGGGYDFTQAQWAEVTEEKPLLSQIFAASVAGDPAAAYGALMTGQPAQLACLLNLSYAPAPGLV